MKKFPSQIAQQEEHRSDQIWTHNVPTIMAAPLTVSAMVEYVCEKTGRDWCVEVGVWVVEVIGKIIEKNSLTNKTK